VAAIQFTPADAPSENLAHLRALTILAANQGAVAVVLPEHALVGPLSDPVPADSSTRLREMAAVQSERALAGLARDYAIWIVSSTAELAPDGKSIVINSKVFDHTGELARRQAKLQPNSGRSESTTKR
jgi:predicted amidohydrolase